MSEGSIDEIDHLSASAFKKWRRCPEQFRLRYISDADPGDDESKYLDIGNAVHETIEQVLARWPDTHDEGLLKDRFLSELREQDHDLSDESRETVVDCLSTAARFVAKQEQTIIGVETPIEFDIDVEGHELPVIGYIDISTEGEVWDWKTGKSEGKDLDEALQAAVYMVGYYVEHGEEPDAIRYAYLKEGKVRSVEPSDELWSEAKETARSIVMAYEADEFPADPGESKCHFCSYEPWCTGSKVGGGNIDWGQYP